MHYASIGSALLTLNPACSEESLQTLIQEEIQEAEAYLILAYALAAQSRDTSNQNGAIILWDEWVVGKGFNDLPKGVRDLPERHERPLKYSYFRHAERAAIYRAAREGNPTQGAVMYCPWFACADCAIGIIESGITRVVGHKERMEQTPERWLDSIAQAFQMLTEAGVHTEFYSGRLGATPILVNSELWTP